MADNLIFPIGFDLEEAVKKAGQDWNSTYANKLEKLLAKRPINVRLQLDVKSITDLTAKVSGISGLSPKVTPKIDTTSFEGALKSLQSSLQAVDYGNLTEDEASAITTLTKAVNSLARAYVEKNRAAALEDKTTKELKAATAAEKRAKAELATAKAIEQRGKKEANVAIAKANQTKAEENAAAAAVRRAKAEEALVAAQNRRKKSENDLAASAARMEKAQLSLANAQNKAANATRNANREYHNQDGYISRLLKRMAVYVGYSAVVGFLRNVREVTAEFELQRVSLGAIIQDQQRANQLFAEIKSFALTSPLKILDLTKYTKQVAAYGIETEKVFGTTKMLADISVGLGVSLDRLALFYGQVFATGYLRASEVRQATEAGIPLVDKLAAKLSEANGKLVTAADVMDLISKRAISFEQVEEVFQDMTSAGGEFYNMQVKQSQTLFGMWSKLGDAAALMYDEIGNTSSVNAGMKATLGLLETLMRNWKTTARMLDTVGVALAFYVIGLKNAAVASKALAGTTALLNLAHQQQIIQTPKRIAGIIGVNNATKISTILTKAHTGAVLRQAVATNVLTKGFWKLTAAMLANPWVAVAAAIAAVGVALFHFIGNTETAAERTEKLNNSVASLKNLDDTTKPLIDTYNELINKTERTAEEQKKLSEVTHELAKQYPGAINAVGDFGGEIDLVADKLNKLYQAEKKARMDNTRYEFDKTQKKIEETEAEIAQLQAKLQEGTKTMIVGSGISGYTQTITVKMSDEDKGKILKQIDDLRYGEDGQGGLVALKQAAEAAEAAMKGITVNQLHIEKFGAWKKTLTTFRQQVGNVRVQLFDDSTIAQFGSLDEALKKTAEEYKKNIALVATYNETLKSANLTAEERAKIEGERAEADAMATLAKNALKYYNALSLLNSSSSRRSSGGTESDNRLSQLREIEQTLTTINSRYEELLEKEGQTKALADIQKIYGDTLKYINKLGRKFKLNFAMPTEFKTLQDYRKAIQDVIEKLKMKGYEKAALELQTKIDTGDVEKLGKEVEAKIKALADRISRTKTAREFYDKVLGMTGDVNLAGKVALSIYGSNGNDLKQQLAKQIRELTNDLELPDGIISADNIVDYKALREWAELNKDELGKTYDELVKIAEQGQKDLAKTYEGYLKDLEKAKSYSDKRIELARYTANKIAEINASTLPQEEKERLTAGYNEREDKEAAKLEYEAFKDTPMYVQMFADLDNASTTMLRNMQSMLTQLKGKWGEALDPTQLKEMQSRLNEIDEQLARRNPFKAIGEGIGKIRALNKQYGSLKNVETELSTATKSLLDNKDALTAALQAETAAREAYNKAVAESGADSTEAKNAKSDWSAATTLVNTLRKSVNLSEEEVKLLQEIIDKFKEASDEVDDGFNGLGDYVAKVKEAQDAIKGAVEEWTALGDDELWNAIFDGLDKMATSAEQGGEAVAAYFQGDYFTMVTKGISSVANLVSGIGKIFWGSKVAKANKEIKRQQELLEQLEYSYGRLQNASDKAFGGEYLSNYKQQIMMLQAQQTAYLKQAEAERSKGKDEDEEKTKGYLNNARDVADQIKELQSDLVAHFTGSSKTDVARQMAKSWVDARASMSDTFAAIKGDYADMIKNMIVEGAAARVIENALTPMWNSMEDMLAKNDVEGAIDSLINGMDMALNTANNGMEVLWKALEARGYDMKSLLGDTDSEYTGIAKTISGASSEEILTLAGGVNTALYYLSPIPDMAENVAAMRALLETGTSGATAVGAAATADYTSLMEIANHHLESLPRIEQHTANIYALLKKVIVVNSNGYVVNTNLK